MSNASLAAFRRVVTTQWPRATEANAKAHLLRVARAGHEKTMREQTSRSGVAPEFSAYANAPGNSNLDSVVLPGPVVFKYRYLREIVQVALTELQKASPVQSGEYARSHTIYLNGSAVPELPVTISPSDEIFIANPVDYARRVEIGKTKSGRDFVMQVPNRIYERVAKQKLMPVYRDVAKITFGYVDRPEAYITKGGLSAYYGTGRKAGARGGGTSRKRRQTPGSRVQAPAIFISALT